MLVSELAIAVSRNCSSRVGFLIVLQFVLRYDHDLIGLWSRSGLPKHCSDSNELLYRPAGRWSTLPSARLRDCSGRASHMNRRLILALGIFLSGISTPLLLAQSPATPTTRVVTTAVSDTEAVAQSAAAFEVAFNSGNAVAVAALWTEDGEYVDDGGQSFKGRKAIQGEYERVFADGKDHKIRIVIDSLTLDGESTATEQGRAMLDPAPAGAPAFGSYTATHTKVNGKWLMSKVVDARIELPSSYNFVADLDWLIGTWVAEEYGSKTVSVCSWVANKSFVQRIYTVTTPDQITTSGVQMIGYNPQGRHVQSWNFSPDGGHAVGTWWPRENGWMAQMQGMSADGRSSSATVLLTRLDDNAYVWQSINRMFDGQSLPETDEVILKRQQK